MSTDPEKASKPGAAATAKVSDDSAANILPVIRVLKSNGFTTFQAIANALNARNVKTARGGTWSATQVARILDRP